MIAAIPLSNTEARIDAAGQTYEQKRLSDFSNKNKIARKEDAKGRKSSPRKHVATPNTNDKNEINAITRGYLYVSFNSLIIISSK